MDDLDVRSIDEILKQAARIRSDTKCAAIYHDNKPKQIGNYKCNGCGEENSMISTWCFRCGLQKFGNPPEKKINTVYLSHENAKRNIYNTDQILQDLNFKQISSSQENPPKPREINTKTNSARGQVKVFKYNHQTNPLEKEKGNNIGTFKIENHDKVDPKMKNGDSKIFKFEEHEGVDLEMKNSDSIYKGSSKDNSSEDDTLERSVFSSEDIILYDRGENKKNKKRLYIKPLSTPSLITTTHSPTAIKNAWSSSSAKQAKPSGTPLRTRPTRPQSASRPQSPSRNSSLTRKNSHSVCSKKPQNTSLTPSVFERLYKNENKPKIRSVQSSPNLTNSLVERNKKSNSVVTLTAPLLW